MQIIEWSQFLEKGLPWEQKQTSVTIGVFDGVHRGHQTLIERIVSHKDKTPVVITFQSGETAGNIQSFRQKSEMLENLGVEILLVIDFTEPFMRTSGIEFLDILLKHCNIGFLAIGNNFRCGYRRETNAAAINEFFTLHNISVEIVPEVMQDSLPISSSRIRSAIAAGNIPLAEAMLGRAYDKNEKTQRDANH